MTEESIIMSHKEIDRLALIQQIECKQVTQRLAAEQLKLSTRQVRRLVRLYRNQGAEGLTSRHRGRRANNAIAESTRTDAMTILKRDYVDFSPTFAHEKLTELHSFTFSVETLRQWMMQDELWVSKSRRATRVHQRRPRRSCFGELIQIDGSPHDWFEGRGEHCTLIVFIDDATSRLTSLLFAPTETTQAYMEALQAHLKQYGRPVALYSDKHSIFRVNRPDQEGKITQFTRTLKTLDIEPIHANSPQAKGRVERANKTLQDRLVKEMRLLGISNIKEANAFLPTFIEQYNNRFAVGPRSELEAHRDVLHDQQELDLIFTLHHTRKLSKNLTCQFKNREYQVVQQGHGYRLRQAGVTICEPFEGQITMLYQGKPLKWKLLAIGEPPISIEDEKSIQKKVSDVKARQAANPTYKPKPDHPWIQSAKIASLIAEDR
jgi:hypothetical protein